VVITVYNDRSFTFIHQDSSGGDLFERRCHVARVQARPNKAKGRDGNEKQVADIASRSCLT